MIAIFRFDGGGARGPARILNHLYGVPASAMSWSPVIRLLTAGTEGLKACNLARAMSPGVRISEGRGPAFEGCIFLRQDVVWLQFEAESSTATVLPIARFVPEFASTAGSTAKEAAVELLFADGIGLDQASPLLRSLATAAGVGADTRAKLYLPANEHSLAGIPVAEVGRWLDELAADREKEKRGNAEVRFGDSRT